MLLAALVLPLVALSQVGWQGLGPADGSVAEARFWDALSGNTGWFAVGTLLGMASIGLGPVGQPHLLNRIMALKAPRDIALARGVALCWFVVVLGGMYLLGLCAHVWLRGQTGAPGGEQVFFVMAEQLLPAVLTGVLVAAVLSAIMSTADSQLLVAGAAIHHDLMGGGSDAGRTARGAVIFVAGAATLLALYLPEAIFTRVLFAWNALGAAFGPIVIARLLNWRIAPWSVPAALLTGFGLTVLFYSLPDGPGDLWERGVPFVVALLVLLCGRMGRQTNAAG